MSRRKRNSYFQCRQFRIEQGDCAMKVTTDASLLGAWVPVEQSHRILDIGSGTGLLALFAAQRSKAQIDAVEIDPQAAEQARVNFANSPWPERLRLIEQDIRLWARECENGYDCILCNPPFFSDSTKSSCERTAAARHNDALPLDELAEAIERLLSDDGSAWLLLPLPETEQLIQLAAPLGLHARYRLQVRTSGQHPPHREILQLNRQPGPCQRSEFILYSEHPYHSREAAALFAPYYTKLRVADEQATG
ncbi:tRNA1(Val) (adenine(37)-N6)-methyltransferase [Marinobacterium arenosum]|uniref:tRNA1(Val) (adenine(37)-N6)-methyltransferase n=1 Tax=Marinobacterium arenosum TaxID=2862496 RepID=UPI001C955023|nr:methyltransferase [Marinobacterium arenosum]MBY4676263.1 methyltransferase [Marinobacterium arenosum]